MLRRHPGDIGDGVAAALLTPVGGRPSGSGVSALGLRLLHRGADRTEASASAAAWSRISKSRTRHSSPGRSTPHTQSAISTTAATSSRNSKPDTHASFLELLDEGLSRRAVGACANDRLAAPSAGGTRRDGRMRPWSLPRGHFITFRDARAAYHLPQSEGGTPSILVTR